MLRIVRIQTQRVHELLLGHSRSNGHGHLHVLNKLAYVLFTRNSKGKINQIKHERKRIQVAAELGGIESFSRRRASNIFLGAGPKGARTPVLLYTRSPRGLGVANIVGLDVLSLSREERVGRVSIASTQLTMRRKGLNHRDKKRRSVVVSDWVNPGLPVYHASLETEFKLPVMSSHLQLLLRVTVVAIPIIPRAVDL